MARPTSPERDWQAALRGDRAAFEAMVEPCLEELLQAARRELRRRIALGDLGADDLTAEELVGEVLLRAWHDRQRRPSGLRLRAWLLALLFRVTRNLSRREARLRRMVGASLETPVPPEPIYDDDEEFWEWYQPDESTRWEDVVAAPVISPEGQAAADEELTRTLDPRTCEVFLLCELHRVPLPETALALGLPVTQTARLLEEARHRLGLEAAGDRP
jgi:RNA polymerase sigma factor (sigma-70 family)